MIYLIGGAPRVGKSIAAKRIAEIKHANFISTDDLCSRIIETLSDTERRERFPLPSFSGTASENVLTPQERVDFQWISARSLEPEIDKIVKDTISSGKSTVIEGVHLLPDHVRALIESNGLQNIQSLFVGLKDVNRVVDGIMKNSSADNWMKESSPAVIRQVAEFVAASSVRLQEEAVQNHLSYLSLIHI